MRIWCRWYATHFVTFRQVGFNASGTAPVVDLTLEQCLKRLETALRVQKRQYEQQLSSRT